MKRLGRLLAYIERGKKYVAIANSALIFIIFLQTAEVNLKIWHYIALPFAAIIMYMVIGFMDTVMGFRKMENLDNEKNGPIHMDMYRILKRMEQELNNKP